MELVGGHGAKALVSGEPFKPVTVLTPIQAETEGSYHLDLEVDEIATTTINSGITKALNFDRIIGLDLMSINKPDELKWIENSLLLREHRNRTFMRDYRRVANIKDSRLLFHNVDLSYEEGVDRFLKLYESRFGQPPQCDAVTIITMRYQLQNIEEVEALYKNAAKFLHKDGFVMEQDFVRGSGGQPWGYVTKRWYPHHPDRQPEVVAYWKDDRCFEMIIPDGSPLQKTS